MARHSEEECAYCERDLLPLSYLVGEDEQLYCSIKCAQAGEQRSATEAGSLPTGAGVAETDSAHA